MTISALPDIPTRGSLTFSADIEAFLGALPTFVDETNAMGAAINNLSTNSVSTTSLLIGVGSKSLTVETGKSYALGMTVKIAYTTTPTNWMSGAVTAYNSGTGAMTVSVTETAGSGTYAAWTISMGIAGGVSRTDIQSGASTHLSGVAGTNTITATASPTLTAYAAGQVFSFVAAASNTGAVTLAIDGLAAKAVTRDGALALRSGDILSGAEVQVGYDGTQFQLLTQQQRVRYGSPTGTGTTSVAVSCDSSAMAVSTTASNCVAVGKAAGGALTSGSGNTLIGTQAGEALTTQTNNTVVGAVSGASQTGLGNTIIGADAYKAAATGNYNVAIGHQCVFGQVVTGSNNIVIGYGASLAAVGDSNTFTLGASIATLRCATTTITSISDERDKADIVDLDLGLAFLQTIQPRRFTWASRDGCHPRDGEQEAGFIAQELGAAQSAAGADYLELVFSSNPDRLEAAPGKLLPIVVKAVQDLAAEVADLRARLAAAGVP